MKIGTMTAEEIEAALEGGPAVLDHSEISNEEMKVMALLGIWYDLSRLRASIETPMLVVDGERHEPNS